MYCGVRIPIDIELEACLQREEAAWHETTAARNETRAVLERKLFEITFTDSAAGAGVEEMTGC